MKHFSRVPFFRRIFLSTIPVILLTLAGLQVSVNAQKTTDDQEALKLNATLIPVPAVVLDRTGKFISNLSQQDFTVLEDGKRQDVSFFTSIKQPFHAVLVLDTSNSAQDRLRAIQLTATGFTKELTPLDKMMIISFDNEVRQLTDFTNDQTELESAIKGIESGFGKLLYEAVGKALENLKDKEGRRAVILFSDGVDMKSIEASVQSNLNLAGEVGAVIYVVRFDTRWWIETEARKHQPKKADKELPFEVDGRIPLPPEYGGPDLTPPGMRRPRIEISTGGGRSGPPIVSTDGFGNQQRQENAAPADAISTNLDKLYGEANSYMQAITSLTGGAMFDAGTFDATRSAFAHIADELRNQYVIGYYPKNEKRDGKFHKIKVEVSRKDAQVRARTGYR
jgi:VWFA-related protein